MILWNKFKLINYYINSKFCLRIILGISAFLDIFIINEIIFFIFRSSEILKDILLYQLSMHKKLVFFYVILNNNIY